MLTSSRPFGQPSVIRRTRRGPRTMINQASARTSAEAGYGQVIRSDFLIHHEQRQTQHALHLIVLNWTVPRWLVHFWHEAIVRVCADGGANRLYDELPQLLPQEHPEDVRKRFLPDAICGDMDSVRQDVRDFYTAHGVPIRPSSCQDTTDLMKCLSYIETHHADTLWCGKRPPPDNTETQQPQADNTQTQPEPSSSIDTQANGSGIGNGSGRGVRAAMGSSEQLCECEAVNQSPGVILALGALGGRLDHTLSSLNVLHTHSHLDLGLIGDGNIVRLVRPGRCLILPARQYEGPACGLVPLSGPATVTMTGFRWNLERGEMRVGGLVSTSNLLDSDELTVETDNELLWTTQLRERPDSPAALSS